MSTNFPSEQSKYWGSGYAAANLLPGVVAAEPNLKLNDFAIVENATVGILLYVCTNPTSSPAQWTLQAGVSPVIAMFGGGLNAGATLYQANATGTPISTSPLRYRWPRATLWTELRVRVRVNGITATSSFTVMKDGGATAITCTIGSTATGDTQDLAHTAAFAADDDLDLQTIGGVGGTSLNFTATLYGFMYSKDVL